MSYIVFLSLGNAYSALAVSDNGNFVATGTMMEVSGDVGQLPVSISISLLCRAWSTSTLHLT